MTAPQSGLLGQVSAAHLVSHFHIMTVPALLPLLPTIMNVSFVDLGIALTVFNIVTAVVQAPLGYAVDRFGAMRLLKIGLALGSISFALLILQPTFWVLIIAMVLAGVANGVYHPCDYALLSRGIAPDRMGRAFSIHTFAGFLGSALAPLILMWLAIDLDIRAAFIVSAGLGLLVLLLLVIRAPPAAKAPPIRTHTNGKATRSRLRMSALGAIPLLTLFFLLLNLSTGAIEKFSVAALVAGIDVPLPAANLALTAFLFASAFGVLVGGVLADRTERHGIVGATVFALAAILIVSVTLIPMADIALIATLGSAGFLTGCIAPSRDMLVRAAAPAGTEGRVFGIVSTGFNLGGVIGPLLFGYLMDSGAAIGVLWASAGFMMATTVIVLLQERLIRLSKKCANTVTT
ncbi:MFS transporter [Altererythrobacter sp. FM1]|uniref:MFS transporter n=1 Tax=Tsuneonella flava TaxID=2055955 RepID=UPI000C808B27|nr:MFS transporter [Tsuneonella flava]ROT97387.1 MFS transporter [Altererythrobacter sp. FM1]